MKKNSQLTQSDFWWLTSEEQVKYRYIYVCHQKPYSDEPNAKIDPYSAPRYFSLDKNGYFSKVKKRYPLEFIHYWREKFANINVSRSFNVFSAEQDGDVLIGPFLIDIDRDEDDFNKGYVQNLDKALQDTRKLVNDFLSQYDASDSRIFFSGHKGFNIEIRPQALGIVSEKNRTQQFKRKIEYINNHFGSNFVDRIHCEIRLHNSINRWISNDGKIMSRIKFELSLQELHGLSADEICSWSEKLALNYLAGKQAV